MGWGGVGVFDVAAVRNRDLGSAVGVVEFIAKTVYDRARGLFMDFGGKSSKRVVVVSCSVCCNSHIFQSSGLKLAHRFTDFPEIP